MISPCALTLLFTALTSLPAVAAPLYKWTDSAGRVTYASAPPPGVNARPVAMPPAPTEDEVREAQARLRRMQTQLATLEEARRVREEEEARRRARPPSPARVIERPVYVPQPIYVPVLAPPLHRPHRPPPPHPHPDRDVRRR